MAQKSNDKEVQAEEYVDLPLPIRIADIVLEQMESSVPLVLPVLRDAQNVYMEGIRAMLKTADAIETRSTRASDVVRSVGKRFEDATPILMQTQRDVVEIAVRFTQENIRWLRRNMKSGY